MEETKWLFDEFTQHVFDKLPKPFEGVKNYITDGHEPGLVEDDLWEMWYYYINSPVMRYVNNYYQFEKYDPKVFEKNMYKAIDNYVRTNKERLVNDTRKMMLELSDVSDEVNILDTEGNRYKIYFEWVAEPDACEKCRRLDGMILKSTKDFVTHWNCRCRLEEHVTIISPDGQKLDEIIKIL